MKNAIILLILIIVITAAIAYIAKNKKKGVKCIGCPYGSSCIQSQAKDNSCNCGCSEKE